jgi:hypothetical protein
MGEARRKVRVEMLWIVAFWLAVVPCRLLAFCLVLICIGL